MDIDVIYNSGAFTTLTPVVLQRGLICASGVYNTENLRVKGRAVKTNTIPCGAYRGFGAPQTFFAVEMMMDHIAKALGADSLEFRERHLVKQGDATSTSGLYHFHVPLPEMIEKIDAMSGFREKRRLYQNQTGRSRKGVGLSLFFHGCGFTGSGERDFIKAVVRLKKNTDDTVTILAAAVGKWGRGEFAFLRAIEPALADRFDQFCRETFEIIPAVVLALADGQVGEVGALVDRSQHEAERALGNQVPETVFLARSAREHGAVAASAFGAGFGGSVWALVESSEAADFSRRWQAAYEAGFPARAARAQFFQTLPGPAAMRV
jgi:hypothetical protein